MEGNEGELLAAGNASEFFLEAPAFGGIFYLGQLVGQLEEAVMLSLFGLQAGFDQIYEDSARRCMAGFGQRANPFCDARRERDALAHRLVCGALTTGLFRVSHDHILGQPGEAETSGSSKDAQE